MPAGSRRRPPPPHHRRAMTPASVSISAPASDPAPAPTKPLYLRGLVIAAAAALAALLLLVAAYATRRAGSPPAALLAHPAVATRFFSFDLVREYPHDPDAFTQGLLYAENDTLFESTGLYHRSSIRKVDLQTGKVLVNHQMDGHMFGEGLTLLGDRLFQVTWLKNDGFTYDRHNFSKRTSFTHKMRDGWGLATDGKVLFGSDGTSMLYKLDPKSLEVYTRETVRAEKKWKRLVLINPRQGVVRQAKLKNDIHRRC